MKPRLLKALLLAVVVFAAAFAIGRLSADHDGSATAAPPPAAFQPARSALQPPASLTTITVAALHAVHTPAERPASPPPSGPIQAPAQPAAPANPPPVAAPPSSGRPPPAPVPQPAPQPPAPPPVQPPPEPQ